MGIIGKLFKRQILVPKKLPAGSFVISRKGEILVSTFTFRVAQPVLIAIGGVVMRAFTRAEESGIPLHQLEVYYGALRVTAKRTRVGAIVFLTPQSAFEKKSESEPTTIPRSHD
jgi:hypothetical protein